MKFFIALVFCFAMCWLGWRFIPAAMGTWFNLGSLPITGYMVVFIGALGLVLTAKR